MVAELRLPPSLTVAPQPKQLDIQIGCSRDRQSFVRRQYASYPFRLSRPFRLDRDDPHRVYLYIMNTSPGLFAGDNLHQSLHLDASTSLYLTDQSATKVHRMAPGTQAQINTAIQVGDAANLEWLPEPEILYADASLTQSTRVTLHPTSRLFLSEMLVPGRLARGESYQFEQYCSRLQVQTPTGELLFADTLRLEGKQNPFDLSPLFSGLPVIAALILVQPDLDLSALMQALDQFAPLAGTALMAASSPLPNCHGLVVRATADRVSTLKTYCQSAVNYVRQATGQPALPEIPK